MSFNHSKWVKSSGLFIMGNPVAFKIAGSIIGFKILEIFFLFCLKRYWAKSAILLIDSIFNDPDLGKHCKTIDSTRGIGRKLPRDTSIRC